MQDVYFDNFLLNTTYKNFQISIDQFFKICHKIADKSQSIEIFASKKHKNIEIISDFQLLSY
jgi:hypothetical protein